MVCRGGLYLQLPSQLLPSGPFIARGLTPWMQAHLFRAFSCLDRCGWMCARHRRCMAFTDQLRESDLRFRLNDRPTGRIGLPSFASRLAGSVWFSAALRCGTGSYRLYPDSRLSRRGAGRELSSLDVRFRCREGTGTRNVGLPLLNPSAVSSRLLLLRRL